MKSLLVLTAALASVLAAQETPVFFRDVPGPPKPQVTEEDGHGLRIYHGDVAGRTQFPFQAALYIDLSVFCGGSLIHPKWVLTAAHCVAGGNVWYVFLGVTESQTPRQVGRETFITRGAYNHPKYNSNYIINDIGVIQLMRPATLSTYIALIPLTQPNKSYIGQKATVSGFGRVDDASASPISPVLMYTTLPIVDNSVCSNAYGATTGNDPSVICLQAEGSSSCKGDSGGPLTLKDETGKLVQVGAVSFGASAGCTLGMPVGYTNIAMFIDWLSETTGINFP